jgi:hypothetical protein
MFQAEYFNVTENLHCLRQFCALLGYRKAYLKRNI